MQAGPCRNLQQPTKEPWALFVLACLPVILRYNLSREASQKIYAEAE